MAHSCRNNILEWYKSKSECNSMTSLVRLPLCHVDSPLHCSKNRGKKKVEKRFFLMWHSMSPYWILYMVFQSNTRLPGIHTGELNNDSHCTRPSSLVNLWPTKLPDFVLGDLAKASIVHIAPSEPKTSSAQFSAYVWPPPSLNPHYKKHLVSNPAGKRHR